MRKPLLFKLPAWYAPAAVFLLSAIIYSCKKDQHITQNALTPETASAKIQSWLAEQKTDSLSSIAVTNLLNNADWKTAHTIIADSGRAYLVVPLKYLPTFDDTYKTEERYLTLLEQNGSLTGFIYDLYGNKTDLAGKADNVISLFNQNNMPGFTGEVTLSNWRNVVKELKGFSYGNMVSHGKVTQQAAPNTKKVQGNVKVNLCDDYYWILRDQYGTIVSATYLFSICYDPSGAGSCDQQPYAIRDNKGMFSVRTNCGGGNGSGTPSANHEIIKDPCSEKKLVSVRSANGIVASLDSAVYAKSTQGSESGLEHAANINLSDWQGGNNFISTAIVTGGTGTVTPNDFTWDSINGYNIGFTHYHPEGTAPSPQDIFKLLAPVTSSVDLQNAGANAIDFYKKSASVKSETTTGSYVVTIADWAVVDQIRSDNHGGSMAVQYNNFITEYNNANPDMGIGEASAYALNQIFGGSINIYYALQGSTNYHPLTISKDYNGNNPSVVPIPCPTN